MVKYNARNFDFGRLTVQASGPVEITEEQSESIKTVRTTTADVNRPIEDVADFTTLLANKRGTGSYINAVAALIEGEPELDIPGSDPHGEADAALEWEITIDGSVSAWVDLAADHSDKAKGQYDLLESTTKRDTVGHSAHLAALEAAKDAFGTGSSHHEEILERYENHIESESE